MKNKLSNTIDSSMRKKHTPSGSGGSGILYVRVDQQDKDSLQKRVADEDGWSDNTVVSQLLKYFLKISPQEQRDIVSGVGSLTKIGELMSRIAWLQHAFGGRLWEWALEECYELARISEAVHAYDIWTFAQYRAAFCWLEMALLLRRDALFLCNAETWNDLYAAAEWCLCASIVHNRCHSAGKPPGGRDIFNKSSRHPIIAYNLASGMSLRAQYAIERKLGPKASVIQGLAAQIKKQVEKATPEESAELISEDILEGWKETLRDELKANKGFNDEEFEVFTNKVGRTADVAMKELSKLTTPETSFVDNAVPRNASFMVRYAPRDPDLAFLKNDKAFKKDFKEFTDWQKKDGGAPVMLRAFSNAQKNVPPNMLKIIEEWASENRLL